MKTKLLTGILLLFLTGSCRKDTDIGPADLLYQRWHILQFRNVDDSVWAMYNTDGIYDTEYRADGTLIYRKDGAIRPTPSCSANRYERRGAIIQYADFEVCPTCYCVLREAETIRILREDLLELQSGNTITRYMPIK